MPPIVNRYTRLAGIDHPIVQEGLGPFRTPKQVLPFTDVYVRAALAARTSDTAILRSLCASLPGPGPS